MTALLAQLSTETNAPQQDWLLAMLLAVPILGGIAVALLRKNDALARTVALGVGVAVLALSMLLLTQVVGKAPGSGHDVYANRFVSSFSIDALSMETPVQFMPRLSVDPIGAWMVLLTGLLTPLCIWASFGLVKDRPASYYAWMLLLCAALNGAFLSRDALLFYVFFEVSLVPCFFIIGGWGGSDRKFAAMIFFLYTFLGSLFMLASILYLGSRYHTFDVVELAIRAQNAKSDGLTSVEQFWVLAGLLAGLCVKVPLVPLHSWLPPTYAQAPTPLTAMLSGVLAKLGLFGLIRLAVPIGLLSTGSGEAASSQQWLLGIVATLAVIAILYSGLIAWVQSDAKVLVAYSSISHLAFCVLALCALNAMGVQATVLYMVNHGISTAAIFLMIGMIESRYGTRRFDLLSGLGKDKPVMAFFFVLFVMSSIGLPLTNGFVSEFLSILSVLPAKHLGIGFVIVAASGILLGAIYMLHMLAKLFFGAQRVPMNERAPDLSLREIGIVAPLAIMVFALGIHPGAVLQPVEQVASLISHPLPVVQEEKPVSAPVRPRSTGNQNRTTMPRASGQVPAFDPSTYVDNGQRLTAEQLKALRDYRAEQQRLKDQQRRAGQPRTPQTATTQPSGT